MENDERSESIRAGHARASGKQIGARGAYLIASAYSTMRNQEKRAWPRIARRLGMGVVTVRRAYYALSQTPACSAMITKKLILPHSSVFILRQNNGWQGFAARPWFDV